MISGAHVVIYSKDAGADRAFFSDVLRLPHVDAGHGWLIFALPPAEAAFHPGEKDGIHELYLTCDDLESVIQELGARKIVCAPITEAPWGKVTRIRLPGGGELGLYQPKHPLAHRAGSGRKVKRKR